MSRLLSILCSRPTSLYYDVNKLQQCDENKNKGFDLLEQAAEAGDLNSIFVIGQAYHIGAGLPNHL